MNSLPKVRIEDIVVQEFDNEVLIYDLKTDKAFCLNETSAAVWQACNGQRDVNQIAEFIGNELNLPANNDLIYFAIDQLNKENLLEKGCEISNHFPGMSRREVIKKVGLGSMIALPIVASLVAPQAANALSTCGTSCRCNVSVPVGSVCTTNPGANRCPASPTGCQTCRAGTAGADMCFFA